MGPLISAGQRETVASFVDDDAPVAIRGAAPDGPGYWFPPTVLSPVSNADRAAARGDLRAGRLRDPVRGRGGGGRRSPTTRSTASRARSGPATARKALRVARAIETGVLSINSNTLGAGLDAVRRLQAVGRRPRARPRRARALHRGQERLLRDGGGAEPMADARRQGLRDHRRRQRHRRRDGAAVRGGGRDGRRASTSTPGAEGDLAIQADVTDEEQVRGDVRAGAGGARPRSTSSSTTPGINPQRRRLGAGDVARGLAAGPGRQPRAASSSAASTGSRTCSTPAAAR